MRSETDFDVAIVGGGLAGLAASILLSRAGHRVGLFEKEAYPFHKVCGEYISLESWGFLESLGLPLKEMRLPLIDTLKLTAPNGKAFLTRLPLGGFGISRHWLDQSLANIAVQQGITVLQNTKVDDVTARENVSVLSYANKTATAALCLAAYGKRSNLDVKWKRAFVQDHHSRLNNFIGVKYHIRTEWPENTIGLHNFADGYCGISKIEGNEYCLCYMTKAKSLKACNSRIETLEETVLHRNPHLKSIFWNSEVMDGFPITISQINFGRKTKVENGLLMMGDTAGMITPLCGNGMSIALHTGKMAAGLADDFLRQRVSRSQMESFYQSRWRHAFAARLYTGRIIQSFFGGERLSNGFVGLFRTLPFLAKPIIRLTHGKPF